MSILEKEVSVKVNSRVVAHYESKGYTLPGDERGIIKMGESIKVKPSDLPRTSGTRVTKICDVCGVHNADRTYRDIIRARERGDGLDRCVKCYNKKSAETRRKNYVEKNGSIAINDPEFAKLFWNVDDTHKYSYNSDARTDFKCPICNNKINNKVISSIHNSGLSCPKCSDGKSYPEKFVAELLNQTGVEYNVEIKFEWSDNRIYDFYIKEHNMIIEVHGKQHYIGGFEHYKDGRNKHQEKENDLYKRMLATSNGIERYIEINASESDLNFIKDNILKSEIKNFLDLSNADWLKCHEYACDTIVKLACNLWNSGYGTTGQIGDKLKTTNNTIARYLKQGNELGWCDYDPVKSKSMTSRYGNKFKRPVIQLTKEGEYVSYFDSISEALEYVGLKGNGISNVLSGRQKTAGGFKWKYSE